MSACLLLYRGITLSMAKWPKKHDQIGVKHVSKMSFFRFINICNIHKILIFHWLCEDLHQKPVKTCPFESARWFSGSKRFTRGFKKSGYIRVFCHCQVGYPDFSLHFLKVKVCARFCYNQPKHVFARMKSDFGLLSPELIFSGFEDGMMLPSGERLYWRGFACLIWCPIDFIFIFYLIEFGL